MERWFQDWDDWERAMDEMFERLSGGMRPRWASSTEEWIPPLDLSETRSAYIIQVELPGIEPEAISLTIERDELIISGEKPHERHAEGERFHRIERRYGPFRRVVRLPGEVNRDAITASARNGVLTIHLPKRSASQPEEVIPITVIHEGE